MGVFAMCAACRRHVRRSESACPFCGARRDAEAATTTSRAPRLGRAGLLARRILLGASVAPAVACGATGTDPADVTNAATAAPAPSAPSTPAASASSTASARPTASATEEPQRKIAIYGSTEIRILDTIPFDDGSSVVPTSADPTIDEIVGVMRQYPDWFLVVEGHADPGERDPAGVAAARGRSVSAKLQKAGLDPSKIRERPAGASKPIVDPKSADRGRNRRVGFQVERADGGPVQP